jgi:hypothetical protein
MCHSTRQTKAGQIDRTITVTRDFDFGSPHVVAVVFERKHLKTKCNVTSDAYVLERVKCDIGGQGVLVHKQNGEMHHVHLDRTIGDSCSCEAGTYTGKCRHLDAVRLALSLNLL